MNYLLFFSLFLLLSMPKRVCAQNDLTVDDYAFVCEPSVDFIEQSLQKGARAFLIEIEENNSNYVVKNSIDKKQLEDVLETVNFFLNENKQVILPLIFKGTYDKVRLTSYLNTYFNKKVLFKAEGDWPKVNDLKEQGTQVLVVFESDFSESSIQSVRDESKYLDRFSANPLDALILFNSSAKKDSTIFKHVFEFWKTTGKVPNFITAPNIQITDAKQIADYLNNTRRFRGVVEYEGEFLNEISWANLPKVNTPAKFSFPLTEKEQVLSPYKNGYRITPAEVIHHVAQSDAPRLFTAYDVVLEDALEYDFSFNNKVINNAEQEWRRIITKDISYVNDSERGEVLYLNTEDSFIDYSKENTLNFETPISISVWLKPEKLPKFMGVLGFGLAFSVKLNDGNPDFTTATIKDHIIEHPLKINIWQHLVVVYNPRTTVEFYLDGEKIGDIDTSEIIPSDQSLVIGNNIWGEQFYGAIDDLKVWDRGLAPKEVKALFEGLPSSKANIIYIVLMAVVVFVFIGAVMVYKRKKSTKVKPKTIQNYTKPKIKEEVDRLSLFGSFELKLAEGQSPSFSPLHKQLVSFLILSTIDEKEGVTTNKLTETFWPGVFKVKAKENRNGNIRKLRMVLSQTKGLKLIFEDKKWRIMNAENFEVDIFEYIRVKEQIEAGLANRTIPLNDLQAFLDLLKKGNVLQSTHAEWVDYFKAKLSNEVEHLLSKVYHAHHNDLPAELSVNMAKTILLFDSLNENALQILITELVILGKHGLAQNAYATFSKNYESLYAEPYRVSYQSLLKNKIV